MARILHVLDHSLPLHSGYTFRTRAIMKAQGVLGFEVRGITSLRFDEAAQAFMLKNLSSNGVDVDRA